MSYLELEYTCSTGGFVGTGEDLGYDGNTICDLMGKNGMYGEDGSGYFIITKTSKYNNEILDAIIQKLIEESKGQDIKVIDEY